MMEAENIIQDYTGMLNLGGYLFNYDRAGESLVAILGGERTALTEMSSAADTLVGIVDRRTGKLSSGGYELGNYSLGGHHYIFLPKAMLREGLGQNMEDIRALNQHCIKDKLGVVMIDDRLNAILRGEKPRFDFIDQQFEFDSTTRVFRHCLTGREMPMPERSGVQVNQSTVYYYDNEAFTLRAIDQRATKMSPSEKYLAIIPDHPDPFYTSPEFSLLATDPLERMLHIWPPGPDSIRVFEASTHRLEVSSGLGKNKGIGL